MKTMITFLFSLLSVTFAFSQTDTCFSNYIYNPPLIDGYATDTNYINWRNVSGTSNNNIFSFSTSWDYNYLYVAVKVSDLVLYHDSQNPWEDDAIELYLDANNNHATTYDIYDRQLRINYNSNLLTGIGDTSGIIHNWKPTIDGYSVEYAFPWTNLSISPSPELKMGFDIGNSDDDNGGNQEGNIYWKGNNNNWQNTIAFGTVKLVGTPGMAQLNITNPLTNINVYNSAILSINWLSSNIDSVYIERSVNGQSWQYLTTVKALNGSYTPVLTSFMPGTSVKFRLSNSSNHIPSVISANFNIIDQGRILLRSNSRFHVYGFITEDAAADTVIKVLTANYNRIADSLDSELTQIVTVDIYPTLSAYHNAIGMPNMPDWAVGNAVGETNIHMVTPYNPGPVHTFSSIIEIIAHELVHCFVHKVANGAIVPIWLNEGTATYISYQATTNSYICTLINQLGGKPGLTTLNDFTTFANIGGYSFSYTIAEFVAKDFGGCAKLSQFISSNLNYSIFNLTNELAFQSAWFQYLDSHYPCGSDINDLEENIVSVYPNPVIDQLNIAIPENYGKYNILLYSDDGKLVKDINDINDFNFKLSVKDIKSGLYFLFLKTENNVILKKIIKKSNS